MELINMSNITNHERFTMIHENDVGSGEHSIIKDNETGMLYYMVESGRGGLGLTPLLDADGKPIIDK